jgi:uncharacterized protein
MASCQWEWKQTACVSWPRSLTGKSHEEQKQTRRKMMGIAALLARRYRMARPASATDQRPIEASEGALRPAPWYRRVLRSAPVRIVLAMFGIALAAGAGTELAKALFGKGNPYRVQDIGALAAILSAYWLYVRFLEKRPVAELGARKALPHLAAGLLAGFLMVSAVVGAAYLSGAYRVKGVHAWQASLLLPLVQMMFVAVIEEVLFRGIFFRVGEQAAGSWIALLVSCAIFGAGHLSGDGAGALAIANTVLAGTFFVAVFMVTRSLWLCIGIHAAWNYVLGTIYSVAVSGHELTQGWLAAELAGPDWMTGGEYGLEASVLTLVLLGILNAALLRKAVLLGRIVPMPRKRVPAASR